MVVMSMVIVTATPYAAARFDEVQKATTSVRQASMSSQFTSGM